MLVKTTFKRKEKRKMQITLRPLEGITIDDKFIQFGMSREEVTSIMGAGDVRHRHFYYDYELAIDYDVNNAVSFIELLSGLQGTLKPFIYGMSVFERNADELFDILKTNNGDKVDDNENGYSYVFQNISVGVYRTSTPESVQRDIDEMKADGVYDQAYVDEELMKANHWATIGLGKTDYYR